jgi:hypothetical protein
MKDAFLTLGVRKASFMTPSATKDPFSAWVAGTKAPFDDRFHDHRRGQAR